MSNAESTSPHRYWAATVAKIVIALVLVGGAFFLLRGCHRGTGTNETDPFIKGGIKITGTKYFQCATVKQNWTKDVTDDGGWLPNIVVSVEAPIEFTYYVPFNDDWHVQRDGQVIYVLAPPIEFNKPSVDPSLIKYTTKDGSIFRSGTAAQERLKERVAQYAEDTARENIPTVREHSRKEIEDFVAGWASRQFGGGGTYVVKAYFPGEPLPAALSGGAPTPKM